MTAETSPPRSSGPIGGLIELISSPAAPGLALMAAAALAFAWANSPLAEAYHALFALPFGVELGEAGLRKPLLLWINDGLMALFFLLVGLEVKRELAQGHLSSFRKAALPVAAAIGGMAAPALLYAALNAGGAGAPGWAIPMATDIAFALGVVALLGKRVPFTLKVFLAAFAVADDIGAVMVIALFYTAELKLSALALAAALTAVLGVLNRLGVKRLTPYMVLGALLWLAVLKSGVHATIAGVVLALTVPLHGAVDDDHSPLVFLEHALHPWVSWLVLPIFALANAGVTVIGTELDLGSPIALGVAGGLVLGKLVGIPTMSWLAVRLGLGELPEGTTWGHVVGVGLLGGIGFTMSIFVAGLAFVDPVLLDTAKVGILGGSLVSAALGTVVLVVVGRSSETCEPVAEPAAS